MNYELVKTPASIKNDFFKMNKNEAKEYFDWFTANISTRMSILNDYLLEYCPVWESNYSKESLSLLSDVFPQMVSSKEVPKETQSGERLFIKGAFKKVDITPKKGLSDLTVSFCFDVAIYFGECLRLTCSLPWGLSVDSKKNINYGQPVLKSTGSPVELNPRLIVENLAYKALEGSLPDKQLVLLYDNWKKLLT